MRPNILFLCTDQQRADSLGCYGQTTASTPHLDALAACGIRFDNHLTPNQICCPSRGTMMTGLYPRHHGMTTNGRTLKDGLHVLPALLADAGYDTHAVGKLHLQPILAHKDHGYPESVAFWAGDDHVDWNGPYFGYRTAEFVIGESLLVTEGGHYAAWLKKHHPRAMPLFEPAAALEGPLGDLAEAWVCAVPDALHYNTWIADRALAFLARARPPFMMFVSTPDPHHPFSPPRPWADLHGPGPLPPHDPEELTRMPDYISRHLATDWISHAAAAVEQGGMTVTSGVSDASLGRAIGLTRGMESQVDHAFGRILATLAGLGLADDTVVVFTSDHGEFLGHHGLLHKGPPPWHDLTRVSFIMKGPGLPQGSATTAPSSHLDIMPTLLDLAGIALPPGLDGRSLRPLFEGRSLDREARFLEFHPRIDQRLYNHSIVTDGWRLTLYPEGETHWGELFDRESDPAERRNLFHDPAHRSQRDSLAETLTASFPAAPGSGTPLIAKW